MDVILIPLFGLVQTVIELYTWVIIIHVIMSWLVNFNIINTSNQFVGMVNNALYAASEPALQRIRRFMPSLGGLDISPIVLIIFLMFISRMLARLALKVM